MEENQNKSGYGKRPLWQWVALYLAIGAVLYGVIYYFVISKNGNGYGYTPQQQQQPQKTY